MNEVIQSTVFGMYLIGDILILEGDIRCNHDKTVYELPKNIYDIIIDHIEDSEGVYVTEPLGYNSFVTALPILINTDKLKSVYAKLKLIL